MTELGSTAGFPGVNIDATEFGAECTDSFTPPPVDKSLQDGNNVFYYQISAVTEESPIE